jgi:hypothetical protein
MCNLEIVAKLPFLPSNSYNAALPVLKPSYTTLTIAKYLSANYFGRGLKKQLCIALRLARPVLYRHSTMTAADLTADDGTSFEKPICKEADD